MLATVEYVKTLVNGLKVFVENQIKSVSKNIKQADWEQNDPANKGYVKSRPFYKEEKEDVLFNGLVNLVSGERLDLNAFELSTEKTYKITWDGVEYDTVCNIKYYYAKNWKWCGNASFAGPYNEFAGDSGEPFLIIDGGSLISNQSGEHAVSITSVQQQYHTLDPKYLRDVESALTEASQKILNTPYSSFVRVNDTNFVRSQEAVQYEFVNSSYYSRLNLRTHKIFVIVTPTGKTYKDATGKLQLSCYTYTGNEDIVPIKSDGTAITSDELPTTLTILLKTYNEELCIINPKSV